jgi:hypothetical protein
MTRRCLMAPATVCTSNDLQLDFEKESHDEVREQ